MRKLRLGEPGKRYLPQVTHSCKHTAESQGYHLTADCRQEGQRKIPGHCRRQRFLRWYSAPWNRAVW